MSTKVVFGLLALAIFEFIAVPFFKKKFFVEKYVSMCWQIYEQKNTNAPNQLRGNLVSAILLYC